MAVAETQAVPRLAPPEPLRELVARIDLAAIDVPSGEARIRLAVRPGSKWDLLISIPRSELLEADPDQEPDAELHADAGTWESIAADVRGGMDAYRRGRLEIRRNLHLGVGFLAATSGSQEPERLRFERVRTASHEISYVTAGDGPGPPVVCIHGLGATKASFLPTLSAMAPQNHRVIAIDLPGFGDSHKPLDGAYDAAWFGEAVVELLDRLEIDRAHLVGNSMGGRVAIEAALQSPDRVAGLVLISPALAWLRPRQWKWLLRMPLPRLGLIQPAPRPVVERVVRGLVPGAEDGWTAAGVDEFLRSYVTRRGRFAFYEAARNIYMDEPRGTDGFWERLRTLAPESLFVWGKEDMLVPISFMRHVEEALPAARHLELDCGHVPQLERPQETHAAMLSFLAPQSR